MKRAEVADEIVDALRTICLGLPETRQEDAWVGTRWRVRMATFAHVVTIDGGHPPAYARAAGTDGPATVLTFRAAGAELDALAHAGAPFFKPVWFRDIVGMTIDEHTDWVEVAELVTDSYCVLAPKKLAARVTEPPVPDARTGPPTVDSCARA